VIVESDSSPLVILAKLAYFDLLRTLFSQVYISAEVRHEVVVSGAGLPGASEVDRADWIETKQVQNQAELFELRERHGLGIGELSAIVLAKERADIVLLDDYEARRLAKAESRTALKNTAISTRVYGMRGGEPWDFLSSQQLRARPML
jgi:predicted nucleic acid-binding protein